MDCCSPNGFFFNCHMHKIMHQYELVIVYLLVMEMKELLHHINHILYIGKGMVIRLIKWFTGLQLRKVATQYFCKCHFVVVQLAVTNEDS